MPDQLPGGAPTFEEPDFSSISAEEADDDVFEDEVEEEEAEEEEDEAVAYEEPAESSGEDANTVDGGKAAAVLGHLARSIVDDKESVVIEAKRQRGQLRLYLHVSSSDMGRIIGRRGRTAQAMRTLVRAAAASESDDVFVEIVD